MNSDSDTSKRARLLEPLEGGPSKWNGLNDDEQLFGEDCDGDGFFDAFGDCSPKTRRKRGLSAMAVGWTGDQRLIDIIKFNGKFIPHAVKNLVEQYEVDPRSAMVDILEMLFEACGAKYKLDVESIDATVDNVVDKLVQLAAAGKVEDNYSSKRKELKNFKENLALFWNTLVLECQNGPLFDNILFVKCIDYVIELSGTPLRVYCHIATLVGRQLISSLVTVAKKLVNQRRTTQRQLIADKMKLNDGPRVESLNKKLSQTHKMISTIEGMMKDLFQQIFVNRLRDIDHDIRVSCINALGVWILSYPSLFMQDFYLEYMGRGLHDKVAVVRKTSVIALQKVFEVDCNAPLLGPFTVRFSNIMMALVDDIDVSVAGSAIGLLKLRLRHQLLTTEEFHFLYELLTDESPMIRRAVCELVYDHLIAQNVKGSQSGPEGDDGKTSEVHLGRMLRMLREFPDDPILIAYVIDGVWDDMHAMKDWTCMVSLLLDEHRTIKLTCVDATNLVRLLNASVKKACGEKIVPSIGNHKSHYSKAQKDIVDNYKRAITTALMKTYPQLLQTYFAHKAKLPPLIEILSFLKLELYSLKRSEQSFKSVLDLIVEAFFNYREEDALKACIKSLIFCTIEGQADLRDYAQNKLKDLENDLFVKLKFYLKDARCGILDETLLINLKRFYELQMKKNVSNEDLYDDLNSILRDIKGLDDEEVAFVLVNMSLHISWSVQSIDSENRPSEVCLDAILFKRTTLFEHLKRITNSLVVVHTRRQTVLPFVVISVFADMWHLFQRSKYKSRTLERLGYCPDLSTVNKFWKLCEQLLDRLDDTEEGCANEEYIKEVNKMLHVATQLVVKGAVSTDFLGPKIISHFAMHGTSISEIIEHLITVLMKTTNSIPKMFLKAMKRCYRRCISAHLNSGGGVTSRKTFIKCTDLSSKLSEIFGDIICNKYILKMIKNSITYAFINAPRRLSFLEAAVTPYVQKLPEADILDVMKNVHTRIKNVNIDENPNGWRPYHVFLEMLHEEYSKREAMQDELCGRPRKAKNLDGKKCYLFEISSEDDSLSVGEEEEEEE